MESQLGGVQAKWKKIPESSNSLFGAISPEWQGLPNSDSASLGAPQEKADLGCR